MATNKDLVHTTLPARDQFKRFVVQRGVLSSGEEMEVLIECLNSGRRKLGEEREGEKKLRAQGDLTSPVATFCTTTTQQLSEHPRSSRVCPYLTLTHLLLSTLLSLSLITTTPLKTYIQQSTPCVCSDHRRYAQCLTLSTILTNLTPSPIITAIIVLFKKACCTAPAGAHILFYSTTSCSYIIIHSYI